MNCLLFQFGYSSDSRSRVLSKLSSAAPRSMVILPELWPLQAFNLPSRDSILDNQKEFQDLDESLFRNSIEKYVYVSAGSFPVFSNGQVFNANILYDGVNRQRFVYKKRNLFRHELNVFNRGTNAYQVNLEEFRVSGLICYDLRFPEMFRSPDNIASDLFIVHAAWPLSRIKQWRSLLISRAIENQAFVIGCNGVGEQDGLSLGGNSLAISPRGDIMCELGVEEGILDFELFIQEVLDFREEIPALQDFLNN